MKTKFRASLIAVAIATLPLGASAAGLGRINVFTGLGQPLRAEVEVTGSQEELDTLNARIASPDAFRRSNIEYASFLSSLKLTVEKRTSGAVIKINSDKPIEEPFVDMLLELDWAGGRLVREYTFLLDPAETKDQVAARPLPSAPAAAVTEPKPSASKSRRGSATQGVATAVPETKPVPSAVAPSEKAAEVKLAGSPATGSEYEVKSGDTLSKIAGQTRPDDASFEQMLAALYTSNQAAFPKGDINRIRTGQILKVPEAEVVRGMSREEVRKILSAPSTNFGAYRKKLAAAVAAAPAKEGAAQQSVTGKITPKVDEPVTPSESGDKLKISRTQIAKGGAAGGNDSGAAARAQALEIDLVAREKSLKEANERVAQLEKNVEGLQKLVEMKNQALADLQKQAKTAPATPAPAPKAEPTLVAKPEPALKSEPTPIAKAEPKPAIEAPVAPSTTEQQSAPATTVESAPIAEASAPASGASVPLVAEQSASEQAKPKPKKKVAAPPPPPPEDPGFIGNLLENTGSLAAALGALVLGLGGWLVYRNRRSKSGAGADSTTLTTTQTGNESVIGPAGGQTVDTGSSVLPTDFSQTGMTSIDTDEGVDPVAEADVYMAYGRDAQAEEILLDALKSDPSRTAIHAKLLEIYHQRKSVKQFENIATDLYTQTGGAGSDWAKAADLGSRLDPENPLYRNVGNVAPIAHDAAMIEEVSFLDESVAPELAADESLEFPEPTPVRAQEHKPVAQQQPAAFGSNPNSQMQATWTMPGEIGQIAHGREIQAAEASLAETQTEDLGLDFNLDLDVPAAKVEVKRFEASNAFDFSAGTVSQIDDLPGLELSESMLEAQEVKLSTTNVTTPDALVSAQATPLVLDLDGFGAEPESPVAKSASLDDELAVASSFGDDEEALVDLERTNFEGSLLDFDFDVDQAGESIEDRAIDLSGIDLDLNQPTLGEQAQSRTTMQPDAPLLDEELDLSEEVATKLELAKAYEEMRDFEGARELLEEVLADGSAAQKNEAEAILARLA